MKTDWNYSERADTYDQRADYSEQAIKKLLEDIGCGEDRVVADIGAGTGKLTQQLLRHRLVVKAIEPNNRMRAYGIKNTRGERVSWKEAIGENTGLSRNSVYVAFFGSSFNVLDQLKALRETHRILQPKGWFCCMWNHRDLTDPIQSKIEEIIHNYIPTYDYGSRRKDPSQFVDRSGFFSDVRSMEHRFEVKMKRTDIISAWKSHDTLFRQSNGQFDEIIASIQDALPNEIYSVPYFTRIWFSQTRS